MAHRQIFSPIPECNYKIKELIEIEINNFNLKPNDQFDCPF